MKPLRTIGIAIGLVLALLAGGIAILYAVFDGDRLKAEASRATLQQTQRTLAIDGPLELSLWPDVGIRVGRLSLSQPGGTDPFLSLDSARVAVAVIPLLSKQLRLQRVEVNGLKTTLTKRKDGSLSIADLLGGGTAPQREKPGAQAGAGSTPSTPVQIDIAGIKVVNAQFTWHDEMAGRTTTLSKLDFGTGRIRADGARQTLSIDSLSLAARGKSGNDDFELRLEVPRLAMAPDKSAGETLSVTANLAGNGRNLAARLVLSGLEGNAQAVKIGKLTLDVDARFGATALKAHLDSAGAANIAAQTVALEKIAGSIDLANPHMPMKQLTLPLAGSLRADLAQQTAALDLATQFDESKIASTLRLAKFAPLALGFDLGIDTLNVDKYLPPKAAEDKAPKDDKLDFSALKGLDVNGTVRVGALQLARLKLAKLNAKIRIAGGRLDVAPLSLDLYDGSAKGSFSLNAAGNSLALRHDLVGININPLMKDLADKDLLAGRGNVTLDVASRGDSIGAMKKALAGSASLHLKDGAIKGINLAQSLRDIKGKLGAASGKPGDTTQPAKAGEKTDFSELSASLKIANGIARNEDLALKSPFLRLSGAGDIDIGLGQMNYVARASVVASSAGQGGQGLEQLKGLTVPVRVTGPFDKLSYTLEFGSLVADVAKARVEEKKEEIKAKAEDKVKDKLKGLFGR